MKNHYDVINEYTGLGLLGSDYHLTPSGPVSGMNAEAAGPDRCPTCAGYVPEWRNLSCIKVQSGFGDVEWPVCGDCDGMGTREAYDKKIEQLNRGMWRLLFIVLAVIVVIAFTCWDITK